MKTKKQWRTPHTFVILACIMILATIATYFVPAGEFERYQNAAGETLVLAGSYHQVEAHPESFLALPGTVYRGITDAASTVTFILMIGGAFEIITSTGAIAALCHKLSRMFVNRKYLVIPVFLILFSIFGFTMGMSAEVMIFVPFGIALALSLGLDKVTGVAMIAMGAATGFTAGLLNPFNVGIAQGIAELHMFSGIGYRAFILAVLLAVDTVYIVRYAKMVQLHPEKSVIYGEAEETEYQFNEEDANLTNRKLIILLIMAAGFTVLIYGLSVWGWYFEEMSALFLAMGIACGFANGYGPNKIASVFGDGAKNIVVGALIVGMARSINIILEDAAVIDTIVFYISEIVGFMPHALQAMSMFIAQSLVNCLITSGSGQAVVMMPIMVPIADLIGISRQTAVLAFQLGDGFSNSILPTSSALMGYLGVSKIPYTKWLKFMLPLFWIWTLCGCLFMVGAVLIGY